MLAVGAALLASLITGIGIAAARRHDAYVRRLILSVVALAAGVLVAAALGHLLPAAHQQLPSAGLWALAGFAAMYALGRSVGGHVGHAGDASREPAGLMGPIAIGVHSWLDGLTYAVAFEAGHVSGATAAAGMILHELPEGVIAYTLLLRLGKSPRQAALLAWAIAGATTPLGAALALPILDVLEAGLRPVLVAASAGVILFVGASHLLPQTAHGGRWTTLAFAAGVGMALGAALLHEHG